MKGQVDLVLLQQGAVLQQLGEAFGQRAQRAHLGRRDVGHQVRGRAGLQQDADIADLQMLVRIHGIHVVAPVRDVRNQPLGGQLV
ncbi:hypothetical protein D3C71_1858590 [compost metagenome]